MNQERTKKLEHRTRQIIAQFIVEEIPEEDKKDFGIITVTENKISSDLSYLDVFVSSLKNSEKLTKFLAEYANFMQKFINKDMIIYKTPKIRFRYDEKGEISQNICLKINSL